ncbi:hypothetical protein BURKHO8Y_20110 [Burkholderia sp. 8Y]|uniref:hypothetical protein n=1 Tax=Burkholderia sp. 8Y TaxID=2653133 RepID=UPI0012F3BD0D|nr:hypothetical protein [Burkholderia sp. 8Y]VXC16738.1 hypothetical protein BURKHO8Y_20110 [Burkholderia sp. 8Y]
MHARPKPKPSEEICVERVNALVERADALRMHFAAVPVKDLVIILRTYQAAHKQVKRVPVGDPGIPAATDEPDVEDVAMPREMSSSDY